MFRKPACLAAVFAFCLGAAHAEGDPTFSLTAQPLHAVVPALEITGEFAMSRNLGVSAIAGFGVPTAKDDQGDKFSVPQLELGGQVLAYPFGSFRHGMQLGAEALWVKFFLPEHKGVTANGNGLILGPLAGYKWAARFGLTFSAQGGWGFMFFKAKAKNSNGEEVEASGDDSGPIINGNMGWSF